MDKVLTSKTYINKNKDALNASFHKSKKTRELIEKMGYKLIFLPPYSPELNKIERFWTNMKRYIKNHINNFKDLKMLFSTF